MMKWLRAQILKWLFSGVTSIRVGDNTTTIDTNGVTFGDGTVIATGNCSHSDVTASRALDTIYQNGTKIRIVEVNVQLDQNEVVGVYIGAATPPTTALGQLLNANAEMIKVSMTFVVPHSWYYKVTDDGGDPTIADWHEWDLL